MKGDAKNEENVRIPDGYGADGILRSAYDVVNRAMENEKAERLRRSAF